MTLRSAAIVACALACAGCGGSNDVPTSDDLSPPPMVFTMSNAEAANTLIAYRRSADGTLVNVANIPTGGAGVGHGLENQGALARSQDGRFLYVVNPGSNDLSVFRVNGTDIRLSDRVPSGGVLPVSVAEWNGTVYVLNRHGSADPASGPVMKGFRVSGTGTLTAIAGSSMTLRPAHTNAAQIGISPDGKWIAVTERGVDQIDVIPLSDDYTPGVPHSTASAGHAPFGFAFSDALHVYIAESAAGTASSYDIGSDGSLSALSSAISTGQRSTCWLVVTPDDQWIYVTNTSSRSISSYRSAEDGGLTLEASVAATTAGPPIDLVVDATGDHLSVLTADGSIETFLIDRTSGSLSSIQSISGLPSGSNGLIGN
jgi:6-phosphogluconolactonase